MSFPETKQPYDTWARSYRDWWGPIIEPSAVRLLDRLDGDVLPGGEREPFELLDVGTGTGALAVAALQRWPAARVTGVDPASRMLELARDVARQRAPDDAERLRLLVGSADRLPLPDASVDVVVTSFVIQLVPSRAAALRETARVLRPGGMFACVTWQVDHQPFEPDDAFMDAVDALGIDAPPIEGGSRPYVSPASAAAELRRAGFSRATARTEWLEHRYTPQSYLDTLEHWIEPELFGQLGWVRRRELRREALRHMRRLPQDRFVWRRPLVSIVARRREGLERLR